ncbi:hypothetical protein Acr_00g0071990 [Actinidia rufa]|uniref:Retrovirus-related Pol polyprotein from transposon TNT 1-94-like beta-barrel domain-containing protein n=1 Tax=Actinidia rufa TaxID=165716 RepID=A0A7J0DRQ7_9ERIC|nr:hypothetical protein Acr_00g0071990 [Actinidia rufa]
MRQGGAAMRQEGGSRACTRQPRAETTAHALACAAHALEGAAGTRATRGKEVHALVGRDVLGEDISEQSLIDEKACEFEASEGDYSGGTYKRVLEFESWETLVVSLSNSAPNEKLTTSMVMDALFNKEARRREMGSTDQIESQALVLEGSKEKGRGQERGQERGHHRAQVQSSDTAATAVMTVDKDENDVLLAASDDEKSDWVLDSGSTYHLCRDREVFSTYAACERRIWMVNNTSSRVVGRGGATIRHGSSGISEKNGQGKQPFHRGMQSKRRGTWRIRSGTRTQGDALRYVQKSGQTRVMQPVQDVYREAQRKEIKSILKKLYSEGCGDAEASLFCS